MRAFGGRKPKEELANPGSYGKRAVITELGGGRVVMATNTASTRSLDSRG